LRRLLSINGQFKIEVTYNKIAIEFVHTTIQRNEASQPRRGAKLATLKTLEVK